jgi:hypothetical protein
MGKLAVLMALMLPVAWPASAQVPLTDVQLLEGPWEYTSPSGIKGILIKVETAVLSGTDAPMIDWQTVSICVYHRLHGQSQDTHCFAPAAYNRFDQMLGRGGEENYTTDLKNRRLVIHYNVDLELSFDAAAKHWAGTWSERGEQGTVILERPHPVPGLTQNAFVGDWESHSEATTKSPYTGSLHITESSDGVLTAWLDRQSSYIDRRRQTTHSELRNGERLEIVVDQRNLTLTTTNKIGLPHHYSGTLSNEGEYLAGEWKTETAGRLAAPDNFVRLH